MPANDRISILGRVLKRTRQVRAWTLANVAERSGLSATTLSKVERGALSLTYEKIVDLARGLELDVGELFYDGAQAKSEAQPTRRSVTRAGDGVRLETDTIAYRYLNTDLLNKRFYPLTFDVKARSLEAFGPFTAHQGEQFLFVLEGELEVHTEHYEPVRLKVGDAIYFDSSMRHAGISVGKGPCRVLGVLSSLDRERENSIRKASVDAKPARPSGRGGRKSARVQQDR